MNRLAATIALAAVAFGATIAGAGAAAADETPEAPAYSTIAHRGYIGGGAFESTYPAIKAAVEQGYAGIEMDVRFTKDHRAVMLHDPTLDRTTSCTGLLSTFTLAKLAKCDAGGGAKVPTLLGATTYIVKLSKATGWNGSFYIHVKEKLTPALAAGLVKAARVIGPTRVVFNVEKAEFAPALIKAGWDGKDHGKTGVEALGLMVHTAAAWKLGLDPKGPFTVLIPFDSGTIGHDAVVTAERAAAVGANGDRLVCLPDLPQSLEDLLQLGCTTLMI